MKKIILIAALLLQACSSTPLNPAATRILVSNKAPKHCQYLGQVFGHQGDFFRGAWTSNRNLEEGAMNDLRNQAHQLGGNYVQLLKSRAGVTGSYGQQGGGSQQTNVTNTGNVYLCPPEVMSKLG